MFGDRDRGVKVENRLGLTDCCSGEGSTVKQVLIGLATASVIFVAPSARGQLLSVSNTVDDDMSHLSTEEAMEHLSQNGTCFRCQMSGASFIGITMQGTDLRETDLTFANFNEAFLRQANLGGADMGGAVFTNGYYARPDFRGANLSGADFSGSRLFDANFTNTNLMSANLEAVSLIRANLEGADLRDANLTNALLLNITYDETTRWPTGFTPPPSL